MADKPDDVPALSEIGDGDDLPGYWAETTTLTVRRWVKQTLDETRNEQPWNQYLMELQRAKNDPLTLSDVDEIARLLDDRLDAGDDPVTLEAGEYAKIADEVEGRMR